MRSASGTYRFVFFPIANLTDGYWNGRGNGIRKMNPHFSCLPWIATGICHRVPVLRTT